MKIDIFWSEIGSGFGEPGGAHPHQEFRGIPLPGLQWLILEDSEDSLLGVYQGLQQHKQLEHDRPGIVTVVRVSVALNRTVVDCN